jgi:hypothetical protein
MTTDQVIEQLEQGSYLQLISGACILIDQDSGAEQVININIFYRLDKEKRLNNFDGDYFRLA